MPKNSRRLFGFTLIELLVVISIIGILMSIGAVSYSGMQKRARDARRIADMKGVQNAMEQYYAANDSVYPAFPSNTSGDLTISNTIFEEPKTGDYTMSSYLNAATGYTYCACAKLEITTAGNHSNNATTCDDPGQNLSGAGYFCVQELQ